MLYDKPIYRPAGDRGLLVEVGDDISPGVNQRVRAALNALRLRPMPGVVDILPAYRSLTILYDPLKSSYETVRRWAEDVHRTTELGDLLPPKAHAIPVVYGGQYGPDLEWVASFHRISTQDVVNLHTGAAYRVYMIGFVPGFAYLGELDERLATPRRATPRTLVPRGSVGIAQKQTGIYPADIPGGWQIIGRTPMHLFNSERQPPSFLNMGDEVRFFDIREEDLAQWTQ
jgi:KipI family sensor histidine kinase inhibitor